MSDKLAKLLKQIQNWPAPKKDHDQRLIESLEKALKNTTVDRPGCPWDSDENTKKEHISIIIPEGNDE